MSSLSIFKADIDIDAEIFCLNVIAKKDISSLDISGCLKITDACIPVILSLSNLRTVNVSGSGITLQGIATLMKKADLDSIISKNLTITPSKKQLFNCTK